MKHENYLSEEEKEMIQKSIRKQVLDLKESLSRKENFKQKEDWKRSSFVTEGDDRT